MTDQEYEEREAEQGPPHEPDEDLLEEHKRYGEDEGEREAGFDDDS
jgi:hypothetical protein